MRLVSAIPLIWLALGCGKAAPGSQIPPTDDPEGTDDTGVEVDCVDVGSWASVGQPFTLTYCSGCHSSHQEEGDRYLAPVGVDLDTLEGVLASSARTSARVEEGTMPPGAGPTDRERERFVQWLACGAPGAATTLALGSPAPRRGDFSQVVETQVFLDDEDPSVLMVERFARQTSNHFEGEATRTYYLRDGWEAWLVAIEEFDADGGILRSATFEPPLQVTSSTSLSSEQDVQTTIVDSSGEQSSLARWTVEAAVPYDADPRMLGDAQLIVAIADNGMDLAWNIDPEEGIVGRSTLWPDGAGEQMLQTSGSFETDFEGGFPIQDGAAWLELRIQWEAP